MIKITGLLAGGMSRSFKKHPVEVSLGLVFLLNRTPVDIYWSMKFMLILRLPW